MSRKPEPKNKKVVGFGSDGPDIIRGAQNNFLHEVEAALEQDTDSITQVDQVSGMTAAHYASALGNFLMVQYLAAQKGIDLHSKDRFGRDVLDAAIECGHTECIDFLFKRMFPQ